MWLRFICDQKCLSCLPRWPSGADVPSLRCPAPRLSSRMSGGCRLDHWPLPFRVQDQSLVRILGGIGASCAEVELGRRVRSVPRVMAASPSVAADATGGMPQSFVLGPLQAPTILRSVLLGLSTAGGVSLPTYRAWLSRTGLADLEPAVGDYELTRGATALQVGTSTMVVPLGFQLEWSQDVLFVKAVVSVPPLGVTVHGVLTALAGGSFSCPEDALTNPGSVIDPPKVLMDPGP